MFSSEFSSLDSLATNPRHQPRGSAIILIRSGLDVVYEASGEVCITQDIFDEVGAFLGRLGSRDNPRRRTMNAFPVTHWVVDLHGKDC